MPPRTNVAGRLTGPPTKQHNAKHREIRKVRLPKQ
jgi:hypothetical protein